VTGEPVVLSPYGFRLVAGATGMGKSVTMRPWIAEVLANPNAAVIYIDPKHQEYRLWDGKCRVEHEKPAIYALAKELQAELARRQRQSTGTTWTPTPQDPELVVIVDEGAVLVRMAKQKPWKDLLEIFEEIATMGRAGRIWLTWATQYPTKEQGIPPQVVEMMLDRVALSVESAQADRVIFGEKAGDTGWQPSELDALPGLSLVKAPGRKPNPVRGWFLDDETAKRLPGGIIWRGTAPAVQPGDGRHLAAVRDLDDYAEPTDETASVDERVLGAVARADVPVRQAEIVKATGANQGTVSKAIKRLVESGDLVREGNLLVLPNEADEDDAATA
jgi:S-DNA-T family DNA segregation ATPase FtsK/SpoIIIE